METMTKDQLLKKLKDRFMNYKYRHQDVDWEDIEVKLNQNKHLFETVFEMEKTSGEPDVTKLDGKLVYVDFSKETPKGRRNCCFDEAARLKRKNFPPETSAEMLLNQMGLKLVTEAMYHELQKVEPLDLKTSSWLDTPPELRELGGALFGDNRYQRTFIYHNGADSYYGVRGFRGFIEIK